MSGGDMRQQIMDTARARVQAQGYGALSFRELAKEVGIKSSSIHYHFPTKGDLGEALARKYTDDAQAVFTRLLAAGDGAAAVFKTYTDIFRAALVNDNRMCLCGMMAAERDDLPPAVRIQVDRFTQVNVGWLAEMLTRLDPGKGHDAVEAQAIAIFSAIEGAQLIARGRDDISFFDRAIAAYCSSGLIPQ